MSEADTPRREPEGEKAPATTAGGVPAPAPSSAKPKNGPETSLQKIVRKLRWRLHWLAPNHFSLREDSADRKAREQESNEQSRVGVDQELRVFALWGVELFGPNETDALYASLKTLGWTAGSRTKDDGALSWIRDQRAYGYAGGFYNVGLVTRNGDRRFVHDSNHAALPDNVEYLLVNIYQVVPAVTAVVVCFALTPAAARRYEFELNLDRRCWYERGPRWTVRHWDPTHTKQRAVHVARTRIRNMAFRWFAQNLPGYFVGQRRANRLPMAELLITKSENVLADPRPFSHWDWKRIIINVGTHETWTSKTISGMTFARQPGRWPYEDDNHLTIGLCADCLAANHLKTYGGGPTAIAHICHEALDGMMAYYAVAAFLEEAARDLKVTREELALKANKRRSLRTVERIQEFFDRYSGVPAIARELRDDSSRAGQYKHHCGQFTAAAWEKDGPERELAEQLRLKVHSEATRLIEDESSTREQFEQFSTVLSIRESIRTQRRMEWLTVVALLVATLSLLAAVPDPWVERLKNVWRTFQP